MQECAMKMVTGIDRGYSFLSFQRGEGRERGGWVVGWEGGRGGCHRGGQGEHLLFWGLMLERAGTSRERIFQK